MNWVTSRQSTWATAAGVYCYVYEDCYASGDVSHHVRVCEVTRDTGWLVGRWLVDGDAATYSENPTSFEEGRAWAEVALRYVAIDGLMRHLCGKEAAWEGWSRVLAQLSGAASPDPLRGGA